MKQRYVRITRRLTMVGLLFCAAVDLPTAVAQTDSPPSSSSDIRAGHDLFEQSIRPILIEHCYECHSSGAEEIQASLRLDDREAVRRGGDTGPAIVPGSPAKSLLLQAMRHEDLQMPPDQKLPEEVIERFERWIEIGAPDPREKPATILAEKKTTAIDWDEARKFWAFQPPSTSPLPRVEHQEWPRRRHDRFVLARMEQHQLAPSEVAAPQAWLRRISFDLVGLPPTEAMFDAVSEAMTEAVSDKASVGRGDASFEDRVIDQLMASPRFGERWSRVWLDLARYAEDQAHIVGNDQRLFYPNAYLYRDWVIRSFNRDMAFDDFVRFQLAADLCGAPEDEIVALGFLGLGPKYYNRGRLEVKAEEWADRVDTVCRSLLGLTVACARCHDHKYDPIPTADYYAMASVFASTEMLNRPFAGAEEKDGRAKDPDKAAHVVREGKATDLPVFIRGNVTSPGEATHRGFLTILSPNQPRQFQSGSGRLELADRLVDPQNPLTARVFVNRIWAQLIGRPIVGTPSNFGALGQPPSHPQVLDDLAARFMDNGWSIKWLVREIVTSATYRQSSRASRQQQDVDPTNIWLSRMNRKRMSVEAWRDSLLFAAGRLCNQIGGPSIQPDDPDSTRRTVYTSVSRFELNPMLNLYDFPDANVHSARRVETTTPLQKLFAINHPFVIRQAEAIVDQLNDRQRRDIAPAGGSSASEAPAARTPNNVEPKREAPADKNEMITVLYRRLFVRQPAADERRLALEFLNSAADAPREACVEYAHALFASNESLFID